MAKNQKFAVGVDLGGTSIKLGIVSVEGHIEEKISVDTCASEGPAAVIRQIKKGITQLLSNNAYKIQGIGVGAPGIVALKKGTVENPPNLPGWGKIHLGQILEEKFRMKVFVENDANAAAVGEFIFGAGKKLDSFVMVTLGTGVGGGIIVNGELFRGEYGGAGEIGHLSIDMNGSPCNCGSIGCIEAYLGNRYLIQRVVHQLPNHTDSKINDLIQGNPEKLTPLIISKAAELNDAYALAVIDEFARYLGCALASVANLLDIPNFIVGGGVSGFGERLYSLAQKTMTERVLVPLKDRITLKPSKLKNDAGIQGASALVFMRR